MVSTVNTSRTMHPRPRREWVVVIPSNPTLPEDAEASPLKPSRSQFESIPSDRNPFSADNNPEPFERHGEAIDQKE